ncbi:MAG: amidohydrolase, partial [Deltaproteobacteria bacterium]|nr:amidohydrolase [Deltaproteobacteria bacterium]
MNKLFAADKILINGNILTVDATDNVVEAVAIKDGRFLAIGKSDRIKELAGHDTEMLDLEGKTVLPGIIDSHTHPSLLASHLTEINCRKPEVNGIADIKEMIKARAQELGPGKWVRGANFNDSKLTEKRHITRWELDEAAPENPVCLLADTGHQSVVNSKALELSGVTKDTPNPSGGEIQRDESGEPTGLLYEMAMGLVSRVIPPYTVEEVKAGYSEVLKQFSRWGVTSTHDAGGVDLGIRAFQQLLNEGKRQVRVSLMVHLFPGAQDAVNICESLTSIGIESGFGNDWLKVMTLKIFGDGSGAGGTASVYEPQNRGPKGLGIMMTDPEIIEAMVIKAHEAGLRCSIHSIGDKGIDIALDCIEKAQKLKPMPDM